MPLALARQRRAEARAKVAAGIDPSRERQEARQAAEQVRTFGEVAEEWLERQRGVLAPVTFAKATWMLKTLVGPWLGKRPIAEIEPPELLAVLRRIESRGSTRRLLVSPSSAVLHVLRAAVKDANLVIAHLVARINAEVHVSFPSAPRH